MIQGIVAAAALLASLVIHEAAHAVALRGYGLRISEAGLGFPFPPRYVRKPAGRRPFALSLSPWLIGAYVTPHPDDRAAVDALPYRDRSWFYGAGVVVNVVTGLTAGALVLLAEGRWEQALAYLALAAAATLWRKHVAAYLVPVLGIAMIGVTAYGLAATIGQPQGVVGVVQTGSGTPADPASLIYLAAAVSLAVGLMNMLPIFPFDGGRIWDALLSRWGFPRAQRAARALGLCCTLVLVVYALGSDAAHLLGL